MTHNGFYVDLEVLDRAVRDVQDIADTLGAMFGTGSARVDGVVGANGRGLTAHTRTTARAISTGSLGAALLGFGEQWEDPNKVLAEDGAETAKRLAEVAEAYRCLDRDTAQQIQRTVGRPC